MSEIAIRTDGLSKRYLVTEREPYPGIRDSLVRWARRPIHRLRPKLQGDGSTDLWALKNVSLRVDEGEAVGIIGRNGSGKTTLLKVLSRVTSPTEGWAEVRGRVGSLLEVGTGFHLELSGRENMYLSGAILGMPKRVIDERFDEIVSFAGVERFIDTPLKRYSSGMQLRLAFSVAAHLEPEILLVDEILAVGDIEFQRKSLEKMRSVTGGGRTVMFVSHQLNQIRRLCQRAIWLERGVVIQDGPMDDVVGAYEAAAASAVEADRLRGRAEDLVRFLGWKIVDPVSDDEHVLDTLGPVTIVFDVEAHRTLDRCLHTIVLSDSDGRTVWGWTKADLRLSEGVNRLSYSFSGLPVRPGAYWWRLGVYDDNSRPLDVWQAMPGLRVDTEHLQSALDEWSGVLNIPVHFEAAIRSRPKPPS